MFVEQVVDEADKNHGEEDTDPNNDGRMYQKKGEKWVIFIHKNKQIPK